MRNCIPLLLVTLVFAAIAPASCGGTVDEGNPDQSAGGADGGVESGPPSKGGSAGLPGAGGAAPACPINEPYRGEACNPYQGAPCVYSRNHCEYSPWACPSGQWVFNGSAGAIALGCPDWKALPPEGERCDCNGHHWQEWTDAPCWFPGGCATCEGNHWHHVACWVDAGPEASFPPEAGSDALWPPDGGSCDVLGTWKITDVASPAEAVVHIQGGLDAGGLDATVDGIVANANQCGGGTGSLSFSAHLDPWSCVLDIGWFKSWMNGSCFEGDCESMNYRLAIQGDQGSGTRTFFHETCGHGDGVEQTYDVVAVRVP